jgi:hypothetical protein
MLSLGPVNSRHGCSGWCVVPTLSLTIEHLVSVSTLSGLHAWTYFNLVSQPRKKSKSHMDEYQKEQQSDAELSSSQNDWYFAK